MKTYRTKPSYATEEKDWNAWRDEELMRDALEEEKERLKDESTD